MIYDGNYKNLKPKCIEKVSAEIKKIVGYAYHTIEHIRKAHSKEMAAGHVNKFNDRFVDSYLGLSHECDRQALAYTVASEIYFAMLEDNRAKSDRQSLYRINCKMTDMFSFIIKNSDLTFKDFSFCPDVKPAKKGFVTLDDFIDVGQKPLKRVKL
ncbi:MAG: hypothetical protein PHC66_03555 [Candidatus Nanoarchaeia archaeon]|nr:hypothetical protein [Candidatus Nanoarchaeia archaeon]MDD5239812.1 hypothetical protein [Candidatus Nanoarchaeia archaeon]